MAAPAFLQSLKAGFGPNSKEKTNSKNKGRFGSSSTPVRKHSGGKSSSKSTATDMTFGSRK